MDNFLSKLIDPQVYIFRHTSKCFKFSLNEIKYILMHGGDPSYSIIDISEVEYVIIKDFLKLINTKNNYFSLLGVYDNHTFEIHDSRIIFEYKINISSLIFAPLIYVHDKQIIVFKEINRIKSNDDFILTNEQFEYLLDSFINKILSYSIDSDFIEACSGIFYLKKTSYMVIKSKHIILSLNWKDTIKQFNKQDFLQNLHKDFKDSIMS
jgi:hypothetical protein